MPCLFSNRLIKIRATSAYGLYYFVTANDGEKHGFFKQIGNRWIWYYKGLVRKFNTLADLFTKVGDEVR